MNAPINTTKLLGVGLYSYSDAARFIQTPARQLRRWMRGYEYKNQSGDLLSQPAVIESELSIAAMDVISFRDLLELRFVRAFRAHDVPLQTIRRTAEAARELFETTHPFTCRRFQTDGRKIFATVVEDSGVESLIDLVARQNVFAKIIAPSLYAGIEFDDGKGRALRWFPMAKSKVVVMDPQIRFGAPVLRDSAVPTVALADAVKAEAGNIGRVARLYGVPPSSVRSAMRFEGSIGVH